MAEAGRAGATPRRGGRGRPPPARRVRAGRRAVRRCTEAARERCGARDDYPKFVTWIEECTAIPPRCGDAAPDTWWQVVRPLASGVRVLTGPRRRCGAPG